LPRSLIYHYAWPIAGEYSGSQVHIRQMLKAFQDLDYAVEFVTGSPEERLRTTERIEMDVARGRKFDFVYVWSPTGPTLMPRNNLHHPFQDYAFYRWCKTELIPMGLFYGDVHWRFNFYTRGKSWKWLAQIMPLYWYDWLTYLRWMEHLFLPSMRMRHFLPTAWPEGRISALLPGCNSIPLAKDPPRPAASRALRLFYVGGIVPPLYDLKQMLDTISSIDGICLTLCCRAFEWEKVKDYYLPLDETRIRLVHESGPALAPYYAEADAFSFYCYHPYMDFAMPVKVFESIGYGLPLLVSGSKETARFIAAEGAGWVAGTVEELRSLLVRLRDDRQEIARVRKHIVDEVRARHTWQVRARQVADTLLSYAKLVPDRPEALGHEN
jgi:glycosyltransferase involved in cell wall biosynthesis